MVRRCISGFAFILACNLTGCSWNSAPQFNGTQYPPTSSVQTTFHYSQVPAQCRVFAELLATLPPESSGKDIAEAITSEAKTKGADVLLIGQTRQFTDGDDLEFRYVGPGAEYNCKESWCGWKSGFSTWEEQGDWVNIGYSEWGKETVRFTDPLIMQVAMMRCH
jgi:hypothetical protein